MATDLHVRTLKAEISEGCDLNIDVVVHESVDSTNSWCLQQARESRKLPFACFAEEQTRGRGRRGKDWHMAAGRNIAMSIAWPFPVTYDQLHLLPLSVALAIVKTLEELGLRQVQIKWPNDVYVRDKKIAGILIETQPVSTGASRHYVEVVIGVGLNYDMSSFDEKLQAQGVMLTDIIAETESQALTIEPDRATVASSLLKNLVDVCKRYQLDLQSNLDKFRQQYDYCKEKNVEVVLDNEVLSGVAKGVNDSAELLVLIDGQQRVFNSAEVSVKAG